MLKGPVVGSIEFPRTGRDADTCRPVIAPLSRSDEEDDAPSDRPSKLLSLAVVMGALLGTLIVSWVYVEDHPVVAASARHSAAAAPKPTVAPPAPSPPAAIAVAPQPDGKGFVAVAGPRGARVFDGNKLVGTAPILHAATSGTHLIRVDHAASDNTQTFAVEVRRDQTTPVLVAFDTRKSRSKGRTQPGAVPAKTTARGLKAAHFQ